MIDSESKMKDFVKKNNYLVVFPDKKVELYSSLRKIQQEICIDSSTISKKLKNQNQNYFTPKGSDYVFYIVKLSE